MLVFENLDMSAYINHLLIILAAWLFVQCSDDVPEIVEDNDDVVIVDDSTDTEDPAPGPESRFYKVDQMEIGDLFVEV